MQSIAYSPNGRRIISGASDKTIRIWDAETGVAVGNPLEGHTDYVLSVAYSSDGQRIISGSKDRTIRIWDAETGTAVGKPLEGHTGSIQSIVYSPNDQNIISASEDRTIRIWDANTGAAIGEPLMAHAEVVISIVCSPDGQHIVSGSWDTTLHVWELFPCPATQPIFTCQRNDADFYARPDASGWVRDSKNGLLYCVPTDYRTGLHSPALLTIPESAHTRSITLDFENFVFGTSWTQIFSSANP